MTVSRRPVSGEDELRAARNKSGQLFVAVAVFSFAVSLLMLTGPLFMMQVYDRVLGSGSVETLTALMLLVTVLFFLMAVLDMARNRVMQRIAARFQTSLEGRIFQIVLREATQSGNRGAASGSLRDLDALQKLIASPAALALFDMPFVPVFLAAIFILHPLLGVVAVIGGLILIIATVLHQRLARNALTKTSSDALRAELLSEAYRNEAEVIAALGMRDASFGRWLAARHAALSAQLQSGDVSAAFTSFSKAFRLFLQSCMLAVGAWLVLRAQLSAGAMIAGSILMGRVLAPIDQVLGGWPHIQRAKDGWRRLAALLEHVPPPHSVTPLPRPSGKIEVRQLAAAPPAGRVFLLRGLNFMIPAGTALGVIGPSGAGKSALARVLVGAWSPSSGSVRLGGAALDQYDPDVLGSLIGYLPQKATLFEGTIAENIARLSPDPDPEKVVRAAQQAAAHQMILDLPQGYDTSVDQIQNRLSGGQIQRIGLARAFYDDPVVIILDEPNSNLDNEGSLAVNQAIRNIKSRGGTAIIMAHRPSVIAECDYLLVLQHGQQKAFGPRDEVLKENVQNATQIARTGNQTAGIS